MFASVYNYSSQDAERIGPRQWGCNTSKEDIKRCIGVQYSRTKEARRNQRRNPRSRLSASAWWRTRQCCPVCTGLSGVAPGSLRREAHRQALSGCSTGLSSGAPDSRHRTVRCAPDRRQWSDPTVDCYRRQRSADVACTGHCIVAVRWCTGLSGAPDDRKLLLSVQRLVWGVEAINTTPTGHSQGWEPKQHTKSHAQTPKCLIKSLGD
jgi:hypothetical protein